MERLVDKQVDRFVSDLEKAITKQVDAAARAVRTGGNIGAAIDSEPITQVYQDAWRTAALDAAGKVYNAIDASRKEFTDEQYESWEKSVNNYLTSKGSEQIVLIDNYTKEWVRATVTRIAQEAAEQGLGTDDIALLLRDKWGELSRNRALRIAQTEMNAAANYGAKEGATASGMTRKYWIPARDGKVRPEHLALGDAEPIGINEKWRLGRSFMDRPSDPNGEPGHVINCRCQMGFLP